MLPSSLTVSQTDRQYMYDSSLSSKAFEDELLNKARVTSIDRSMRYVISSGYACLLDVKQDVGEVYLRLTLLGEVYSTPNS